MITDYILDKAVNILVAISTGFGVIMLLIAVVGAIAITAGIVSMIRESRRKE